MPAEKSIALKTPLLDNKKLLDDQTHTELLKLLLTQSWPLMLRGAVVAARYFVISVLLAQQDERLLAPNTLINALESVFIIFAGRSLTIMNSEISKLYGEVLKATNERQQALDADSQSVIAQAKTALINERNTTIGITERHGFLFGGLISLPIAALYYFASDRILQALGQHPFAVEKAQHYFQAAALGFPPLILLTAQQRLLQGLMQPIPVLLSNFLHSTLSIVFSYLFLAGKLGPKLEMEGVGYAFVIAGWTTLLANTLYFLIKKDLKPCHVFSLQGGFQPELFKELALKGLKSGAQYSIENWAIAINSLFLGLHNLTALSADQMAMQMALCSSILSGGVSQAITSCIGTALGAQQFKALKKFGNMGIILGMSFPTLAFCVFLAARQQFISLYVNTHNPDNSELVRLASSFLLLECLRQLVTSVKFTATGALQGFKDTDFTLKTSAGFSLTANAALLCLLHFYFHVNSVTLFAAKVIGDGIAAILNSGRWILKSHEQSPLEKAVIKDTSLSYRIARSARLFALGQTVPINTAEDGLRLGAPS